MPEKNLLKKTFFVPGSFKAFSFSFFLHKNNTDFCVVANGS